MTGAALPDAATVECYSNAVVLRAEEGLPSLPRGHDLCSAVGINEMRYSASRIGTNSPTALAVRMKTFTYSTMI